MKIILKTTKTEVETISQQAGEYIEVKVSDLDEALKKLYADNALSLVDFEDNGKITPCESLTMGTVIINHTKDGATATIYFNKQSELDRVKAELKVTNDAIAELAAMFGGAN